MEDEVRIDGDRLILNVAINPDGPPTKNSGGKNRMLYGTGGYIPMPGGRKLSVNLIEKVLG